MKPFFVGEFSTWFILSFSRSLSALSIFARAHPPVSVRVLFFPLLLQFVKFLVSFRKVMFPLARCFGNVFGNWVYISLPSIQQLTLATAIAHVWCTEFRGKITTKTSTKEIELLQQKNTHTQCGFDSIDSIGIRHCFCHFRDLFSFAHW